MGFFDSTSTASDNRIAGTDQAQIYKGNVGQAVQSGAVALGTNSTLLGAGSTQTVVKAKGKGNTVTVTNNDPAVAQAAIDRITGLAGDFGQSLSEFMQNSNANALQLAALNADSLRSTQDSLLASQSQAEAEQQTNFTSILDKFASLVGDQTPSGDAQKNRIVLYVVLGVLCLVGAIFYFRK